MARPTDPNSLAQRLKALPPGQSLQVPAAQARLASLHVAMTRIRREYADLCAPGHKPRWRIEPPTSPTGCWAITYLGVLAHAARPSALTKEQRAARRKELRAERYAAAFARLYDRAQADPRLSATSEPGMEPITQDMRQDAQQWRARQEARAKRQAEAAAARRAERPPTVTPVRTREPRPLTLPEIETRLAKIAQACEHNEERLEQVEERLQEARDAVDNAPPVHLLSPRQAKRIEAGLSKSRRDRAAARVKLYRSRVAKYEARIAALDEEREQLKDLREQLKSLEYLQDL